MFDNLGVHIIKFPTGRYGYVGTLPSVLADWVTASADDVMAGRAQQRPDGAWVAPKFPSFATLAEAESFAVSHGVTARTNAR